MNLSEFGRRWERGLAKQQRTSLSRSIDPRYATNVAAIGLAVLVAVIVLVVRALDDWSVADLLADSLFAGLASFLAWALGRELDPDRALSAFVAQIGTAALWFSMPASAGFLFALMIAARLLGRTTGPPPRQADLIVAVLAAAFVATQPGGAAAAIAIATALALGRLIGPSDNRHSLTTALIVLVVAATVSAIADSLGGWGGIDDRYEWGLALLAVLTLPFLGLRHVRATADYTGEPLDVRRIFSVRLVVALAVIGAIVVGGDAGLAGASGAIAALAGVAVGKLAP